MSAAIRIHKLAKCYRISHAGRGEPYKTARESCYQAVSDAWRRVRGKSLARDQAFWALRDVDLSVGDGEAVGIIGRNGSGKSTLLKILSRVVRPTRGSVVLRGRVSSLLEVGTGFHPELTGRQNVFLNGSIHGMSRREIASKFEAIVAFAELENFIDTPVKRYSSGMYVRLAFAVAAHLDPEILVVDEVLAVGDTGFQEKCRAHIRGLTAQGRVVLFVSHNMSIVEQLCTRCIWLKEGEVVADGPSREVAQSYLGCVRGAQSSVRDWVDRKSRGLARIVGFEARDAQRGTRGAIELGNDLSLSFEIDSPVPMQSPVVGVLIHTASLEPVLDIRSSHSDTPLEIKRGSTRIEARVDRFGLYPGEYVMSPWVIDDDGAHTSDWLKHCTWLSCRSREAHGARMRVDRGFDRFWCPSIWKCQASLPNEEADVLERSTP